MAPPEDTRRDFVFSQPGDESGQVPVRRTRIRLPPVFRYLYEKPQGSRYCNFSANTADSK